ncbi:MAG TPA: FecR domain-containing protein [Burkholderiales bacterium]|nr:FecR domain-containing protein [Burkholderiales bacterium]
MKTVLFNALFVLALVLPGLAVAQPAAVVEGVQMPAWVERAEAGGVRKIPVVPGMQLKAGDKLVTGSGSRLQVKLAEGSTVKLGENGSLQLRELEPSKSLFKAALGVLEGAFRFTTDALAKNRRREVSISVATVTAGIRGTDLWGKSAPNRQVVCLIEGKIEVGAQGESPVTMDQPLQFYRRESDVTQPVGIVDNAQLAQWAAETEIEKGRGAARRGGKWQVRLASGTNMDQVLKVYEKVRAAGYGAELGSAVVNEKRVYTARIRSLPSKGDAETLAEELKSKLGVENLKVVS